MTGSQRNRFQDFFEESKYVVLKNYLYNYLIRKRAIERSLRSEDPDLTLEIGSGISPLVTGTNRIVYSDLSPLALGALKLSCGKGWCVAADGMQLPFKAETFTHAICSEVLEHLPDDGKALKELARALKPSGCLIVTVPHRKFYFANDDRFVNHYRRYELGEIYERLKDAGFAPMLTRKVLGPLEKLTMMFTTSCFSVIQKLWPGRRPRSKPSRLTRVLAFCFKWANRLYAVLARIDARIMPRALSTVVLIKATRN